MKAYCTHRDILIDHAVYVSCHKCDFCCKTLKRIGLLCNEILMEELIEDYKQRIRTKKLERILS